MNVDLTDLKFHDEDKAREWLEAKRWPVAQLRCGQSAR
jgi:hypothetical protein